MADIDTIPHIQRKYSVYEIDEMRALLNDFSWLQSAAIFGGECAANRHLGQARQMTGFLGCVSTRDEKVSVEPELRTLLMAGVTLTELRSRHNEIYRAAYEDSFERHVQAAEVNI